MADGWHDVFGMFRHLPDVEPARESAHRTCGLCSPFCRGRSGWGGGFSGREAAAVVVLIGAGCAWIDSQGRNRIERGSDIQHIEILN